MTADAARRDHGTAAATARGKAATRRAHRPAVEPLEGRALLSSFYSGPSAIRPVQTAGGIYTLSVSGPGLVKASRLGGGLVGVTVFGSTSDTTLNVALSKQKLHKPASPLAIGSIRVVSGAIGSINASGALLQGAVTPLGGVTSLAFGGLGPNARIDVGGSLGSLSVGAVALGPNGRVRIGGDLGQSLSVGGPLQLDGGEFSVGNDLAGSLSAGSIEVSRGGKFTVGHDVKGAATVSGDLRVSGNGLVSIGHDLNGLTVGRGLTVDGGGQILVGNDLTGAVTVGSGLTLSNGGRFGVGRNVAGMTVNGDFNVTPKGSGMAVGGNLASLVVNGTLKGQNSPANVDLAVGLDLGQLTVLGGTPNLGGIQNANIDVGKSLLGLNVPHGIFNSLITAGVVIDGGSGGGGSGGSTGNVGPDGPDAVYNSQLRAGVEIRNLTIGGNVRSTFATNPASTGYPTRIVAGEDRAGHFSSGGQIDNFQITGQLIDAVIAASVAPNGDSGQLPPTGYGAMPVYNPTPGDGGANTYDAPAGLVSAGTVGAPVPVPNYTELSYKNMTLVGNTTQYNTTLDPTIDDLILPGTINPSFAQPPLPATSNGTQQTSTGSTSGGGSGSSSTSGSTVTAPVASLADPNTDLPLPTKSTVLGGVVSTQHGDSADFAGLFAADTRGVFIGTLPNG